MADTIVMFLIDKLTNLLEEEARLLGGLHDQVTLLRKFMMVFLNNSKGKRKEHEVVAQVVSQIRDVAHEAEDVMDTYIAHMVKGARRNVVDRVVRGLNHVPTLHNVAEKIQRIKTTINEIFNNKDRYGIEGGRRDSEEEAERIRKRRKDVEEEEVVGFEHDSSVVIDQLMATGSRLNVVSIIGHAWGYVSNDYRPKEFFLSLLKCLLSTSEYNALFKKRDVGDEEVTEEELKMKVLEYLSRNKYLVVVDDVWQIQVWDEIKGAFPDDHNGSRILITTRLAEVASHTGSGPVPPPYTLPFLNKEQSWRLLSKRVFQGEECLSDLEPLGKLIAESCDGLPLAIIVMAGILAKEKSLRKWFRIKESVNWHLGRDKTLKDILKLSYDNLPRRLKPCFLYFGMYPEDYEIPVKQLIRLWISEGFLIQRTPRTSNTPEPEYIAEEYLDELVDRSLVQVGSRTSEGGVKTCQIHDLLRDLCISESRDDKFFQVWRGEFDFQTPNSCPSTVHCFISLQVAALAPYLNIPASRARVPCYALAKRCIG